MPVILPRTNLFSTLPRAPSEFVLQNLKQLPLIVRGTDQWRETGRQH